MDELSNEELLANALNDDQPEAEQQTEQVRAEQSSDDQQQRDEQGRFAAKQESEPKPEAKAATAVEQKEEAQIPSWRLREIREERDSLRQQLADFQRRGPAQAEAPKPKPDIFEQPDQFVRGTAQEIVDPVKQEVAQIREDFSKMYAIDKHGEEKVATAYSALDRAARQGDPEALMAVARVKASPTPYQDLMKWHEKTSVLAEVGADPNAWFEKKLEAMLGDEKSRGELLAKLQPSGQQEKSTTKPVFQVPPSLNRAAAAATSFEESADLSNESLFAHAMR